MPWFGALILAANDLYCISDHRQLALVPAVHVFVPVNALFLLQRAVLDLERAVCEFGAGARRIVRHHVGSAVESQQHNVHVSLDILVVFLHLSIEF